MKKNNNKHTDYFIRLYFGLPGCGKTTMYAKLAYDETLRIHDGKSPYKFVYGNIPLTNLPYPEYYIQIPFDYLGRYSITDALVLMDEGTMLADCRDYKGFQKYSKDFFMLHRHYRCSIVFFNQIWDGLDKKIRTITDQVYYVSKRGLFRHWASRCYRIPYGIIIPDGEGSQKLGEIVQGYSKPPLLTRLLSPLIWRKKYYKYFDTFDAPKLPPVPKK